jgi:cyclomaltodextrinase
MRGLPADKIRQSWEDSRRRFPKGALHLRISDDHDEARAVARYGINGSLAASALMFTLDGVPLIYNGMEVGDATESGGGALFDRLPVYWSPRDRPPLREIYHGLIQLRKQYAALRSSRVDWLANSDESRLLSFLRADEKDELLVLINFSNQSLAGKVELKNAAGFGPVEFPGVKRTEGGPLPAFRLSGFEWRVYHRPSQLSHSVPRLAADKD